MLLDTRPADLDRPAARGLRPRADGLLLKRLLLGFWTMYFSIIAVSNVIDLMNALGATHWRFLDSTNFPFMHSVVKVYGVGPDATKLLLVGAMALQIPGAILFWRALVRRGSDMTGAAMQALCWTAFTFMTELFLAYTVEGVFRDLVIITIGTSLVFLLVPDEARESGAA